MPRHSILTASEVCRADHFAAVRAARAAAVDAEKILETHTTSVVRLVADECGDRLAVSFTDKDGALAATVTVHGSHLGRVLYDAQVALGGEFGAAAFEAAAALKRARNLAAKEAN